MRKAPLLLLALALCAALPFGLFLLPGSSFRATPVAELGSPSWRAAHPAHPTHIDPAASRVDSATPSDPTRQANAPSARHPDNVRAGSARAERTSVSECALAGRVWSEDGTPVAGAELSWTPLVDALCAPDLLISDVAPEEVRASTLVARTDAEGRFAFERAAPESAATDTVVWITHSDHVATPVLLEPGEARWPADLHLERARPTSVLVVDEIGAPVPEATVHQRVLSPPAARAGEQRAHSDPGAELERRASLVFVRELSTDPDGRASAVSVGRTQLLVARHESRSSGPWSGTSVHGERVTLTLHTTFSVQGSVLGRGARAPLTGARVALGGLRDGRYMPLGSLRVGPDGTFGPQRFAAIRADTYVAELFADGLAAARGTLAAAQLESSSARSWNLAFEARPAVLLRVDVSSSDGAPLSDAHVTAWPAGSEAAGSEANGAEAGGAGADSREPAFARVTGTTDASGRAEVRRLPAGLVWLEISADAHATRTLGPVHVEPASDERATTSFQVELEPAASLIGRCVHAGAPVTSFHLAWWTATEGEPHIVVCQDAAGAFALDDLPPGEVYVSAWASRPPPAPSTSIGRDPRPTTALAPSPAVRATVATGSLAEVELELPSGLPGRGRIVDRATSEPLAGARVALWSTHASELLAARSAETHTLADGTFVLDGFSPDSTGLEISAPGYATYWTVVAAPRESVRQRVPSSLANPAATVDAGTIALARATEARIVVQGLAEPAASLSGWLTGANRRVLPPFLDTPAGAIAEALDLRPFPTEVHLALPDGTTLVQAVALAQGENTVTFDVAGDSVLVARFVTADGREHALLRGTARLWVLDATGRELALERTLEAATSVTFARLAGGQAVLELEDGEGRVLAVRAFELERATTTTVAVALETPPRRLRVVDAEGTALAGTRVEIALAQGTDTGWRARGTTDGRGELAWIPLGAADAQAFAVALAHPELGRAELAWTPAPAWAGEDVVDVLVFERPVELALRLSDDSVAAADVWVWIAGADGTVRGDATTNAEGVAELGPTAPGTWYAFPQTPGIWELPIEFTLSAEDDMPIEIPIFGLGALELEVTRGGAPVAGAALELVCTSPFARGLEEWMTSEGVPALLSPIETDAAGRATVAGLPRGTWSWTLALPDGTDQSGTTEIQAGATTALKLGS